MNKKEERLVHLLCGYEGCFYTEDEFGCEEINEAEILRLYDTFVDLAKCGAYRPSFDAVNIYKKDAQVATNLMILATHVLNAFANDVPNNQDLYERNMCKRVIKKFPDFMDDYGDSDIGIGFVTLYNKADDAIKYRIVCYLFASLHYVHPVYFDEQYLIDLCGATWWQLPAHPWLHIIK